MCLKRVARPACRSGGSPRRLLEPSPHVRPRADRAAGDVVEGVDRAPLRDVMRISRNDHPCQPCHASNLPSAAQPVMQKMVLCPRNSPGIPGIPGTVMGVPFFPPFFPPSVSSLVLFKVSRTYQRVIMATFCVPCWPRSVLFGTCPRNSQTLWDSRHPARLPATRDLATFHCAHAPLESRDLLSDDVPCIQYTQCASEQGRKASPDIGSIPK